MRARASVRVMYACNMRVWVTSCDKFAHLRGVTRIGNFGQHTCRELHKVTVPFLNLFVLLFDYFVSRILFFKHPKCPALSDTRRNVSTRQRMAPLVQAGAFCPPLPPPLETDTADTRRHGFRCGIVRSSFRAVLNLITAVRMSGLTRSWDAWQHPQWGSHTRGSFSSLIGHPLQRCHLKMTSQTVSWTSAPLWYAAPEECAGYWTTA